jgi:hypothetical protein
MHNRNFVGLHEAAQRLAGSIAAELADNALFDAERARQPAQVSDAEVELAFGGPPILTPVLESGLLSNADIADGEVAAAFNKTAPGPVASHQQLFQEILHAGQYQPRSPPRAPGVHFQCVLFK